MSYPVDLLTRNKHVKNFSMQQMWQFVGVGVDDDLLWDCDYS